jgi:hypothetical protein
MSRTTEQAIIWILPGLAGAFWAYGLSKNPEITPIFGTKYLEKRKPKK